MSQLVNRNDPIRVTETVECESVGDILFEAEARGWEDTYGDADGNWSPADVDAAEQEALEFLEDKGVLVTERDGRDMNLIDNDHWAMVSELSKPGGDILNEVDARQMHLIHMVLGISGESGELLDAIKKHCMYQKDLDMENVVEELGDIEFYLCGLRSALGISRQETLAANITKLRKRYQNGYSNEAAQLRADKAQSH